MNCPRCGSGLAENQLTRENAQIGRDGDDMSIVAIGPQHDGINVSRDLRRERKQWRCGDAGITTVRGHQGGLILSTSASANKVPL